MAGQAWRTPAVLMNGGLVRSAARTPALAALGVAFGTFGELLQGRLPDSNRDFLVTSPIVRGSVATFWFDPDRSDLQVMPACKVKSLRAAELTLARLDQPAGGTLVVDSDLPVGKGFASSSADLVATIRAVGNAAGIAVTPALTEDLLRQIEPSDGIMYPGSVAFYHREVKLHSRLGFLPSMTIVGVDEGGEVDTLAFNKIPKSFTAAEQREYSGLLNMAAAAIRSGDTATIGRVATRSAVLNQRLNPKRMLLEVMEISDRVGGVGVVAAHSGTTLGILLDDKDRDYPRKLHDAAVACDALVGRASIDHSLRLTEFQLASLLDPRFTAPVPRYSWRKNHDPQRRAQCDRPYAPAPSQLGIGLRRGNLCEAGDAELLRHEGPGG
jgi:uncharacterized protein involved in propanediol utilization